MFSVKETATKLGIHEMSVYRLIKNNEIRASKVGGMWRLNPADIIYYLNLHSNGGPIKDKSYIQSENKKALR